MKLILDMDEILKQGDGSRKSFCSLHCIKSEELRTLTFSIKNNVNFTYGSKNDLLAKRLVNLGVAHWETKKQEAKSDNDKVSV